MRRWLFADLNSTLQEVVRTLERIEQNSSSTLEVSKSTLEVSTSTLELSTSTLELSTSTLELSTSTLELSKSTLGAIYNLQQVNREILLELREHRPILERIDHGVQANTEGLLHVLDELRGGPGTAPAT